MRLVKKDAEKILLEEIKESWRDNKLDRCLYLKLSKINLESKEEFLLLIDEIKEFFYDQEVSIYPCHDEDVFILGRQITNKKLSSFIAHLRSDLLPASFHRKLAVLFEVKNDWGQIRNICTKKIEDIELKKLRMNSEERKKLKEKKLTQEKLKIINSKINEDLISTLSSRRSSRTKSTILVVEDDFFSARLIKNSIGKNHDVITAKDGKEAVRFYAKEAPDILFLDIDLPDIDGHTLLNKIFEMDKSAYVVMLSGNSDKNNILKSIKQGAKGFIGKPFRKDKLYQYINGSPHIQKKLHREYA